jgi:GAF domain-containing protein
MTECQDKPGVTDLAGGSYRWDVSPYRNGERLRGLEKSRMAPDHIVELKKWASDLARAKDEVEIKRLNQGVELISKAYSVEPHEVAILGLTVDERSLRFLAPVNLREVGQIPLSSGSALAARTVRERRGEIVNHFYVVPHASVFEGVPIAEQQRSEPIQKIMSAPIMLGNKVIGVLQVSRKGRTAADAGPDFTYPQLRDLKTISDALASCMLLCVKD